MSETKPKRRWFRFSLRTLFFGISALGIVSAIIASWWHSAQRQKAAADALGGLEVAVTYTEGSPEWLQSAFGVDFFQNIDSIMDMGGRSAPAGEVVRLLNAFPHLHSVRLSPGDLTEDDLRVLGRCGELESLCLFSADKVPEKGLRHLRSLRNLRQLEFQGPPLGEESIEVFGQLPKLVDLQLFKVEITDRTFVHLRAMTGLETLTMQQCSRPITGQDLRQLSDMKNLRQLLFTPTAVNKAELDQIRHALPDCRILVLDNTGDGGSGEFMPLNDQSP